MQSECRVHALKIWPVHFADVESGRKTFEIRKDDRCFAVGDRLALREWSPRTKQYTGRVLHMRVVFITRYGQPNGQVVMGIDPWEAANG